ncbi:MAG: NAD(P)/FAD-dependent oxidoreductase, partial [Geodermatophilaceae bacterium]|nr:NAD(P)/FAD-dependent oxidoreductase [Geodermatophilaceae bacterium]
MSQHFDLIVIGAGMAGVAAANKCAAQGWQVAIVDALPYGGTCALRGCDPKKILRRSAEIIDSARLMSGKGIDDADLSINWADLMKHKHGFTDPVPQSIEDGLAGNDVTTLHGQAAFTGARQIEIDGASYDADRFLIATGAQPRHLDFPGHEHLIDSAAFLDLDALPQRILFVGGGFISFEFAHIAARAESSAVIVDRGERPLKSFDPDLVDLLVDRGEQVDVALRRATSIAAVEPGDRGYRVTLEREGIRETIETDLVVHGAGRIADLVDLRLDVAGVEWGEHGVAVGGHLQSTTNPAIWAAGDSADTAGMPLTPVAVSEAKVAASNMIKGTTTTPDYAGIPTAVFTIPELARAGMLESEAREDGIDLAVRYSDTSGWYSNYRIGETTAAAKILIDQSNDQIVG